MQLISVNVGLPRQVTWKNQTVTTGIFKDSVSGRVKVSALNLEGDQQADLTVHGGENKAIYLYPAEHYDFWQNELPGTDLPWGMFGENFTSQGLQESSVFIGDRFRVGSIEVKVTEPRMPCLKLGIRFQRPDMVKRFLASRRTGFYFRVLKAGEVASGDDIEFISREQERVTVSDITNLYADKKPDPKLLQLAIEIESLPESWRSYFTQRVDNARSDAAPQSGK